MVGSKNKSGSGRVLYEILEEFLLRSDLTIANLDLPAQFEDLLHQLFPGLIGIIHIFPSIKYYRGVLQSPRITHEHSFSRREHNK
jgi:hypothetical protein